MSDFYTATGAPAYRSGPTGTSAAMRGEFAAIQAAMAKLAGYTGNGSKFLRVNAAGTAYEVLTVADALAALAPNSAALATALTDTTGTGVFVRTQAPTLTSANLVTPALGTPVSGNLANCTFPTLNQNTTGTATNAVNLVGSGSISSTTTGGGSLSVSSANTANTATNQSGGTVNATSATISGAAIGTPSVLTSSGASISINLATACNFTHTTSENTTLASPSNPTAGQSGIITITQGATPRTLAYNTFWKFASGSVPTLTASSGAVDIFAYYIESASRASCSLLKDIK